MVATLSKKAPASRKAKKQAATPTKAYQLTGGEHVLQGLRLPKRSRVVVIPETPAAEAELQANGIFRRMRVSRGSVVSPTAIRPVAAEAYEPDARARAVLRGIAFAEADLKAAGGAYDVDEVRSLLRGLSRQALDKKVADGSLLVIPGPSGRRRFPAAQFADDGSVVKGLKEVQAALGYSSRWAVLNFLVNGHDLLNAERPVDVLRRGDVGRVVEAAKRTGVQGA